MCNRHYNVFRYDHEKLIVRNAFLPHINATIAIRDIHHVRLFYVNQNGHYIKVSTRLFTDYDFGVRNTDREEVNKMINDLMIMIGKPVKTVEEQE